MSICHEKTGGLGRGKVGIGRVQMDGDNHRQNPIRSGLSGYQAKWTMRKPGLSLKSIVRPTGHAGVNG
jgi:hypothetical protein